MDNNKNIGLIAQAIRELYQKQSKIPPLIENMEGMEEYDLKDYYVRLKTILKEGEDDNQSSYEAVVGEKINIDVNDIFDQIKDQDSASKVLILGGAGVGKSTLMQYLAYKWSTDSIWKDKFDIVYRVALKTLLNSSWKTKYLEDNKYASEIDKEPLRYIIHYNLIVNPSQNLKVRQLQPENINFTDSSRILLLLDGYDEVAHTEDPFFKNLEEQIFKQQNIILTSRPNAIVPSFKSRFQRVIENIGLDNNGIDLYTKLYFKGNTPEVRKKYQSIDKFLSTNAQIKNICNVPVNIAMLCYIFQEQENVSNLNILNISQLYYLVIQKLGERYISKEYKGSEFKNQSLKEKIEEKLRNLPELQALKHVAYCGMTGGGVEVNDNHRKESLIIKSYKDLKDEYQTSIQKSIETLNLKTIINKVVRYGLLKQEGGDQKNKDFSFIHLSFQEYLTAQYLTDQLIMGSEKEKLDVLTYISTHRNEPRQLVTLKFMAGIITNQQNTEILNDFWNSVVCNVEGVLEFSLGQKTTLLMNLLGQSKINKQKEKKKEEEQTKEEGEEVEQQVEVQENEEELDLRIPNLQNIINLIDVVVISNIQSFKETLKDSFYLSNRMHSLISKYVEQSIDSKNSILEEMKSSDSTEKIQQIINYIVDQQKMQVEVTDSEILKLKGLELISYLPHKFKQNIISTAIMSILKAKNTTWIHKQKALLIFNQISTKLKGSEINNLKLNVLEFLLSNKDKKLFELSLESLQSIHHNNQLITQTHTDLMFAFAKDMIKYETKNSSIITNFTEFIKYMKTQNQESSDIQKYITQSIKDIQESVRKLKNCSSFLISKSISKLILCIEGEERFQILKDFLEMFWNWIFQRDFSFFQMGLRSIPSFFKCMKVNQRSLLVKMFNINQLLDAITPFSQYQGGKFIVQIIQLLDFNTRKEFIKDTLEILKKRIKSSNSVYTIFYIPRILELIQIDKRTPFIIDIIDFLLKNFRKENQEDYFQIYFNQKYIQSILKLISYLNEVEKTNLLKSMINNIKEIVLDCNTQQFSFFCELTSIIIQHFEVSEKELIAKEIFEIFLKQIKGHDFQKEEACAIVSILQQIERVERGVISKDLFHSFEQWIEQEAKEQELISDLIQSILQILELINEDEKHHFAKKLIKSFESYLGANNKENLRINSCCIIPKALKYVDQIERSKVAEDLFQSFENLIEDDNIQVKETAFKEINKVLELMNNDKKYFLAKKVVKSLQNKLEDSDQKLQFQSFDYIERILKLIDEAERKLFVQDLNKSFQDFLIKSITNKQTFPYVRNVIEYLEEPERHLFAKEVLKYLENPSTILFAGSEIINALLYIEKDERQIFAKDFIKKLLSLIENKSISPKYSTSELIEKTYQFVNFIDKTSLGKENINFIIKQFNEQSISVDSQSCYFICNLLESLNLVETTTLVEKFTHSLEIELQSSAKDKYKDFNYLIVVFQRIICIFFDTDQKFAINNTILDILFHNKSQSVTNSIQSWYLKQFSQLKSQYQLINNMSDSEKYNSSMSRIHSYQFVEEVQGCFQKSQNSLIRNELAKIFYDSSPESKAMQEDQKVSKIKSILLQNITENITQNFGLPPHQMLYILQYFIGYENEDFSSRKAIVKEAKNIVVLILQHLDQTGIKWILENLSKLTEISNYCSKKIVSKVCDIMLEDGIISNNESQNGLNEFKILVDIIKSSGNVSLNDRGTITVDGKRYTLALDDNGRVSLDKEISEMLKNHQNPFIKQYYESSPAFVNNSQRLVANLDKNLFTIADNEWSHKKWDSVINQNWKLVELEKYNGGKIVFFEKKDIFGKRMVLKINQQPDQTYQLIKIFDSNRERIFGKYTGPVMFYAQLTKHDSWRNYDKDLNFIEGYKGKDELQNRVTSKEKQVLFHDGLLCMSVTSDRMQDIVYFEFMKTIKDQEEELKHEIKKLNLNANEKDFLEYYGGFLKTFSLCYTEALIIASGKFSLDTSYGGVAVLSKLVSMVPMIGDIASTVISSIGDFVKNVELERNANSFLQFAHDHQNLSKKAGIFAKKIILKNGSEFIKTKFKIGYVDMFIAKQNNNHQVQTEIKFEKIADKLSKLADKVLKIKSGIEAKIYYELYVGDNAKLGNEDATKLIELITNNGLSDKQSSKFSTTDNDNLNKMLNDLEQDQIEKAPPQAEKIVEQSQGSNCCHIFMMNTLRYDNPFLNMNQDNIRLILKLTNKKYLDVLNITNEIGKSNIGSRQLEDKMKEILISSHAVCRVHEKPENISFIQKEKKFL